MSRIETTAARGEAADLFISHMTEHDLLEVVEIEEASGLSLWGWDAYHAELRQGIGALMFVSRIEGAEGIGAGKKLRGFVAARLVAGELHVNNVAVREEYRRAGVGRALLGAVIEEAKRAGAGVAFLEVRAGNTPAQRLYERCGFVVTGRRRAYYSDPKEDALVMTLTVERSA